MSIHDMYRQRGLRVRLKCDDMREMEKSCTFLV